MVQNYPARGGGTVGENVKFHYFQNSKAVSLVVSKLTFSFKIGRFWEILWRFLQKNPLDFGPKKRFFECNYGRLVLKSKKGGDIYKILEEFYKISDFYQISNNLSNISK